MKEKVPNTDHSSTKKIWLNFQTQVTRTMELQSMSHTRRDILLTPRIYHTAWSSLTNTGKLENKIQVIAQLWKGACKTDQDWTDTMKSWSHTIESTTIILKSQKTNQVVKQGYPLIRHSFLNQDLKVVTYEKPWKLVILSTNCTSKMTMAHAVLLNGITFAYRTRGKIRPTD